jgi:hypothetical protein
MKTTFINKSINKIPINILIEKEVSGSLTAGSIFLGLRAGPQTVAQMGVTQDLYWFGPPESNTLRAVCAVVLVALICSRGYKWAREGVRSQVSVVFESHGWLEVEEESKSLLLP